MKTNFPIASLGDHVHQISLRNKSKSDAEVFSVTNSEGFTRSTDYFSKEVFSKDISNYKVVKKGQFAYNPSRVNVGSIDYLRPAEKVLVSPLYIVFETDSELDADYLLRYMKSAWGNVQIRSNTEGAVRDSLKYKGLENIKIPLPSVDDQKRIAYLLGKVEGLITRRKQHLQKLDDLLKSVFLNMFGNPVRNERGWPDKTLESFIDQERGISYGIVQRGDDYPGGIPVLRIRDIISETYKESDLVRTDPKNSKKYSRTILRGGELLLSIRGTVGSVSIAPPHAIEWNVSRELAVIPITHGINKGFLVNLLKSQPMQALFSSMIKGVAQSGLNLYEIRQIKIVTPPARLQSSFESLSKRVESLVHSYEKNLIELERLYGALSQKAFKGELDLSKVPLLVEVTTQDTEGVEDASCETRELEKDEFELPEPADLDSLKSAEGRKALVYTWLKVWLGHLSGEPFSVQGFMDAAQQRLADIAEDDAPEWGALEYDELKACVFNALEQGRLTQRYDDANNRVQLITAKG